MSTYTEVKQRAWACGSVSRCIDGPIPHDVPHGMRRVWSEAFEAAWMLQAASQEKEAARHRMWMAALPTAEAAVAAAERAVLWAAYPDEIQYGPGLTRSEVCALHDAHLRSGWSRASSGAYHHIVCSSSQPTPTLEDAIAPLIERAAATEAAWYAAREER